MGFKINMADVANFGSGFLDANAKNTANNLKLRQEELKANRDFVIAQKKDKYAAELELYKEEKKKATKIQRLNDEAKAASAEGGAYDAQLYGNRYLLATLGAAEVKVLKDANPESFQRMALDIGSKPKDFKFSLNRDMIDKQSQADVSIINSTFADEMKNAKGDDALVGKLRGLVGMKKETTADIQTVLEEKLKAGKLIEEVVQEPTDLSDINLKTSIGTSIPLKFRTEAGTIRKELNKNTEIKKENINTALTFFTENNVAVANQFLTKDKDGNVTGLKGPGRTFLNQTNALGIQAISSITNQSLYTKTGGKQSLISNKFNPTVINGMARDRLSNYGSIDSEKPFFQKRNNIIAVVPFSIVDTNDTLAGKYQFTTKAQTKQAGSAYLSALKDIANEQNPNASIESEGKFMNNLQDKLLKADSNNALVIDVQNRMVAKLNPKQVVTNSNTPKVSTSSSKTMLTVFDPKTKTTTSNVVDSPAARKMIEQKGFKITGESKPVPSPTNTITQVEGDVDEQYTTGTEFNVVREKPIAEMTMAERREFEKERRRKLKEERDLKFGDFNERVRKQNQSLLNQNNTPKKPIDFNADN